MTIDPRRRLATFIDRGTPTAPHMVRQEILTGLALGAGFDLDNSVPGASATLIATASSTGRRTDHSDALLWYKCDEDASPLVNSGNGGVLDLAALGSADVQFGRTGVFGKCVHTNNWTGNCGRFATANTALTPASAGCTLWAVLSPPYPQGAIDPIWGYRRLTDQRKYAVLERQGDVWNFTIYPTGGPAEVDCSAGGDKTIMQGSMSPCLVVGTYDGANIRLWFNGLLVQTTACPGTIDFTDPDSYWGIAWAKDLAGIDMGYFGITNEVGAASAVWTDAQINAKFKLIMGW